MLPAIEWKGDGTAGTGLDAARVVYQHAGVFEDHATAIIDAASAVGEQTAIVYSPFTLVEKFAVHPTLDTIRVDLAMLRDFLVAMDLDSDESRYVEELDEISAVAELLAPMFPSEWIWFSERGNWIFGSWNCGDESAIAGVRQFLDAYEQARPVASLEVVEWLLGEGALGASVKPAKSAGGRFSDRLARMRGPRPARDFSESSLCLYLTRLYDSVIAAELWEIHERVVAVDLIGPVDVPVQGVIGEVLGPEFFEGLTGPQGDPSQRLARLIDRDPTVAVRLRELWSAY